MAGEPLGKSEVLHGSVVLHKGRRLCKPGQKSWLDQWDAREHLVPCRVDTAGLGEAVRAG